jgi:hypothetical protein
MKRSTSFNIIKPKADKQGWKPVKVSGPDTGTYDPTKAVISSHIRNPAHGFTKSKAIKFTAEVAQQKKHIPGAGNY